MTTIPKVMKGVQLIGHGGPDMLRYRDDLPVPVPSPDDVLIQVAAAGVNNTDINTRTAWYSKNDANSMDASWSGDALSLPRIQGADVCGTIVAVGENICPSRIGQRVLIEPCITRFHSQALSSPWYFGSECDGGFAQFTVVDSKHAYAVNSSLSDIDLASFPCSYSTAENMLVRSNVTASDTVLISGASGGVGSAAIQLAKARGAYVIAIASPEKKEQITALGANQVIPRDANLTATLGENSVDVVIDLVAGEQWPQFLQVLKPGSRYAVSGAIGGPIVELDVRTLYLKDLALFGCTVLASEVFGNLVRYIEQNAIRPLVAESFPLNQIGQAQEVFSRKQHIGKLVLEIT
ncbi:alcohol dehydrogenase family protein [Vibrio alginolyticus]|jgi:NADPH:quinone reductase-like Zn-dependent oxidoreductase|nr:MULTISPECIES: alcohol dehydrogenase family protein [Vibrio]MBT0029950.1 alcohol dehydrogenase family protein [Vibrio alginolyticus]MBT0053844.1 alcohol dehydrogenase family protein [Vibrio alginolyticus]MCR9593488.1 alcohol dehydrogenase family protein [Vibrio alginolyticus]MDW1761930.1 alcohol dehydrogenase family protein [Vibrio sp. Vb2135]MDW1796661.1 alcohol dehydrogenase family protein [Vibrio sp. Vb2297]